MHSILWLIPDARRRRSRIFSIPPIKMKLLLLLLLLSLQVTHTSTNIRCFVIRSILEDGVRRLIPSALVRIQNTPIPDIEGEADAPLIGKVDYQIKKMKVT